MDRKRREIKVPKAIDNKVKEINSLIKWAEDKDNIVGGYFGSTYYTYLSFKKPIRIVNQFVYIEYHDGEKLVKERYNFNKPTGYLSLEELKWELSRILRAYRKAKKDYDSKGYFKKGGKVDLFSKGGDINTDLDDEQMYEQYFNSVIKHSDYYQHGEGFNSRFKNATNKIGDKANGEFIVEGKDIIWTYVDKNNNEYQSDEQPSIRLFKKGGEVVVDSPKFLSHLKNKKPNKDCYEIGGSISDDFDWSKVLEPLSKEEEEVHKLKELQAKLEEKDSHARSLGYKIGWNKAVMSLVNDTKFLINDAKVSRKPNSIYVHENLDALKELKYGAEKYSEKLKELWVKSKPQDAW